MESTGTLERLWQSRSGEINILSLQALSDFQHVQAL